MDSVNQILKQALAEISACEELSALDDLRVHYLGKKGEVTAFGKAFGDDRARPELLRVLRTQIPEGAERIRVSGVFRCLKTDKHVALGAEVIDLVGLRFLDQPDEICGIGQVAIMKKEADVLLVGVVVEVIDALRIE